MSRTPKTVLSDGLDCFKVLGQSGQHERIVTGGGKASVYTPEFLAVNTVMGNLKTAIAGTYHGFKFAKYAARYLAEFQYRFNVATACTTGSLAFFTPWPMPNPASTPSFPSRRFLANQVDA